MTSGMSGPLARIGNLTMAALLLATATLFAAPGSAQAQGRPPALTVSGNQLVDDTGRVVQLRGLNKSGTEYACAQGWGIFDGPVDTAAVEVMKSWNTNAVRIPLNEHCWLARNGVPAAFAGANYRAAVRGFVDRIHAAGMIAILDLHWTAAGNSRALGQANMANTDHSLDFWTSVATEYRTTPGIVYDLFNEPFHISWDCWRNGCAMPGGWHAAGMQQLLDAVRATGATQPVMAKGLEWGNDLRGWLAHRPHDPTGNLVAGFHVYNFNECVTDACWNERVAPVAARFPVITGEVGQKDCGSAFTVAYLRWADTRTISYLPWTWNDWGGCHGPALLADNNGTPSSFGAGVRTHLLSRPNAAFTTTASAGTAVQPGTK
jgi:endoglucanase